MAKIYDKLARATFFTAKRILGVVSMASATTFAVNYYRKHGMHIPHDVNYISSTAWFDGTDYSLVTIGEGATISSQVSVLTHDWALQTIARALEEPSPGPLGRRLPVEIGPFCFIGRSSILLPGCSLGRGCLVGAGSIVRGKWDEYSILIGNPAYRAGDSRVYLRSKIG